MGFIKTQRIAGLEVTHGNRWGHATNGDHAVYVSRDDQAWPGRPVLIFIDDPDTKVSFAISEATLTALRAAIAASGCPHHHE